MLTKEGNKDMGIDRRYEIDQIMYSTKFWGDDEPKYDVAEDIYWMWYDAEEAETAEERDDLYKVVEEYLIAEGIL